MNLAATAGNLFVKDTNIKTCAVDGISVQTSRGFVAGVLDRVRLEGLPTGLVIGNNAFHQRARLCDQSQHLNRRQHHRHWRSHRQFRQRDDQ